VIFKSEGLDSVFGELSSAVSRPFAYVAIGAMSPAASALFFIKDLLEFVMISINKFDEVLKT
jgi:hypothetical protein